MNLATVAVLHTAMALEDPFDNQGLDGIYVDEALFEAEQVTHCALSLCQVLEAVKLSYIRLCSQWILTSPVLVQCMSSALTTSQACQHK